MSCIRNIVVVIAVVVFNFAFAKAELHSSSQIAMVRPVQSVKDLIPQVEELPREIADTLDRNYDERSMDVKPIKENLRDTYTGNEYKYVETATQQGSSALGRIIGAFFDWLERVFGFTISPFWKNFIKYLFYAILGMVVLYFIIKLLMDESPSALLRKGNRTVDQIIIEEQQLDQIDLKKMIEEKVASGNYREAVRYLYLDALKTLSAQGLIEWDFQKTNADYYRELKDPATKSQFKKISYLYDYVWYGEFNIDGQQFNEAREQFSILEKRAA